MISLEFTTYSEIEEHIRLIINQSLTELKMRNRVSSGNIIYPLCGDGLMVKYTVSHTASYDASAPDIEAHMEFVTFKIIKTIMTDIEIVDV